MQIYIMMSVISFLLAGYLGATDTIPFAAAVGLMLLGGGFAAKAVHEKSRQAFSLPSLSTANADLLKESYAKAVTDYRALEDLRQGIKDPELSRQLKKMQHVAKNLLAYLQQNPARIPLAVKFIDYYQDRAVLITNKYREMEATQLDTDEVQGIKERMKLTLAGFDQAYTEQFSRVLKGQIMDIDAELTVMQQTIAADGLKPALPEKSHVAPDGTEGKSLDELLGDLPAVKGKALETLNNKLSTDIVPADEREAVIKSKLTAGALGIFLGGFGAHKFYLGKPGWGALYLLLFWTMIPGLVGFIEGMRYLFMNLDDYYLNYYGK